MEGFPALLCLCTLAPTRVWLPSDGSSPHFQAALPDLLFPGSSPHPAAAPHDTTQHCSDSHLPLDGASRVGMVGFVCVRVCVERDVVGVAYQAVGKAGNTAIYRCTQKQTHGFTKVFTVGWFCRQQRCLMFLLHRKIRRRCLRSPRSSLCVKSNVVAVYSYDAVIRSNIVIKKQTNKRILLPLGKMPCGCPSATWRRAGARTQLSIGNAGCGCWWMRPCCCGAAATRRTTKEKHRPF